MGELTITLTEEEARRYVELTSLGTGPVARLHDKIKAALPPEYKDGTIAWVQGNGNPLELRVFSKGKWLVNEADTIGYSPGQVKNVRVIPVLKDGEVAVPRPTASVDSLINASYVLDRDYYATTADWLRGVAQKLRH